MERKTQAGKDAELDALFRAYLAACQAPDASANFMPAIWQRIEERQRSQFFLGRWARALVTAAAVFSLGMAAYIYIPRTHNSMFAAESYVEASDAGHSVDFAEMAMDER